MRRFSLIVALLLALPTYALAGTTGKIVGTVSDDRGEVLPGANVVIVGGPSLIGATTDVDGEFLLLNVPAGTYSLKATFIGHQQMLVQKVRVAPDFTTTQNFTLNAQTLEVDAIVVTAEAPLIQRDQTSSARFVNAEEIETLPVRGFAGVTGLQAGVTNQDGNLFIRGGRLGEVAYYVDGVSQQDLQTGTSNTSLNSNAIDQVVVTVGGFDAEYGRVMSGVVNVVTKEGGKDYSGSFEYITDELTSDGWAGAPSYGYNNIDAALGGPLLPGGERSTFFFSGERRDRKDRRPRWGVNVDEWEQALLPAGDYKSLQDGVLPHHELEGWTGQGKLSMRINDSANLKVGGIYTQDEWQTYSQHYRYNLAHSPIAKDNTTSLFATLTWTLSSRTFFTVQANAFNSVFKGGDGVHFENLFDYGRPTGNPRYSPQALFYFGDDPNTPIVRDADGFITGDEGHVYDDYEQRSSFYITPIDFDITSQVNSNHQVKAGFDVQMHKLRFFNHLFPTQTWRGAWVGPDDPGGFLDVDRYGYDFDYNTQEIVALDSGRDEPKSPILAAVYVQDKIEYEGLVLNLGLRYDYLNAKTDVLTDEAVPLGGDDNLDAGDLSDNKAYNKLSPRIGIGFPVTEKTLFHLHYGKFFQQPNLRDLYVGFDYLEHKAPSGGYYYAFGNPNLKPEETTAYEIGMTRALGDRASVNVTAYYKSVRNLVQVQTIPSTPSSFSTFRNTDFGTIKGFDISTQMQRSDRMWLRLNYSVAFATGTGSDPETQRNIAWTFQPGLTEKPKTTAPLEFDQRHNITASVDYRFSKDDGPAFMGGYPLANVGLNVLARAGSGFPYTPTTLSNDRVTLAAGQSEPIGPLNSARGPWSFQVDMKANKEFHIGSYRANLYLWAINLLDRMNTSARNTDGRGLESTVYEGTGSALTTGWLATEDGKGFVKAYGEDGIRNYKKKELDPRNFSTPRQVRLGLALSF